jgi:peptide/nickel transport system substrate-binding protein
MKKSISFILLVSLLFSMVQGITAAESIKINLNGENLSLDQSPILKEGRVLVPLRGIFEKLGATVDWNGETKTIIASKGETKITLTIGKEIALKNNMGVTLDVPAQIINGSTMVPLRFVGEAFGSQVEWDGLNKMVVIFDANTSAIKPNYGGTVTIALGGSPTGNFNPLYHTDNYEAHIFDYVYEGLVNLNDDLTWGPSLAKSWNWSKDKKSLTFDLRQGVKWHDGVEFTADDVVFTYSSLASPLYNNYRYYYVIDLQGYDEYNNGEVETFYGVQAEGKYKVTFNFEEATPFHLQKASFDIIPKHIYGGIPVDEMQKHIISTTPEKQVGTGPFKITSSSEGEVYNLERFDSYWGGKPYLDGISWRMIQPELVPSMVDSKEINIVTDTVIHYENHDIISNLSNMKVVESPSFGYEYLGVKLNYQSQEDIDMWEINPNKFIPNKKLQDINLRQAIAYAIDRQSMITDLLEGYGTVINGHIPSSSWAYEDDKVNEYHYNPEKAKQLLDNAGYIDKDNDGFRELPNGEKLTLNLDYPSGNEVREESALLIIQALEEIGIAINIRKSEHIADFYTNLQNDTPEGEIDLFLAGWALSVEPDPSAIWDVDSPLNFTRYNNLKAQQLLDKATSPSVTLEERKRLYHDWQILINQELPSIFLYTHNNINAYHEDIQGIHVSPLGILNNPHKWYID